MILLSPSPASIFYFFVLCIIRQNSVRRASLSQVKLQRAVQESCDSLFSCCCVDVRRRYIRTGSDFYGNTVRQYVEFDAEDGDYDMFQHFNVAFDAIEDARKSGGRALIHCIMGVNRSGALAVAYTMLHQHCGPITAAVFVRQKRRMLLSNEDFQEQLIKFAQQHCLLHLDAKEISGNNAKS